MHEPVVYMLIGFFIGAVVGGAVVGKQRTKEFEDRIDELETEAEELKAEARRNFEAKSKKVNEKIEKIESKIKDDFPKVDFVKLSKEYKSPEFDAHFADRAHPEDDDPFEDDLDDDPDNIYLISEQEYLHDLATRGNESLTYYQEDGVLCDSEGVPIRNQVDVIGVECMEVIEGTYEDELYVSNDIADAVYLIHVDHEKSYYSDIMGI